MIAPASPSSPAYWTCATCGKNYARKIKACEKCAPIVGVSATQPAPAKPVARGRRHVCEFGHRHDSDGEAACCPLVHKAAQGAVPRINVFIPGRPGIPIFAIDPHVDSWRPVYVSADWVYVQNAVPILAVDYKGAVAKSKRRDKGWARGKRMLETEMRVRCVEIACKDSAIAAIRKSLAPAGAGEG